MSSEDSLPDAGPDFFWAVCTQDLHDAEPLDGPHSEISLRIGSLVQVRTSELATPIRNSHLHVRIHDSWHPAPAEALLRLSDESQLLMNTMAETFHHPQPLEELQEYAEEEDDFDEAEEFPDEDEIFDDAQEFPEDPENETVQPREIVPRFPENQMFGGTIGLNTDHERNSEAAIRFIAEQIKVSEGSCQDWANFWVIV